MAYTLRHKFIIREYSMFCVYESLHATGVQLFYCNSFKSNVTNAISMSFVISLHSVHGQLVKSVQTESLIIIIATCNNQDILYIYFLVTKDSLVTYLK